MKVLLGLSGSVATIKAQQLLQLLSEEHEVKVVATQHALHFLDPSMQVLTDKDEWTWKSRNDPVLHIQLRDWADVMILAPLSANTLAKLANGLCDNLLTCICRAWHPKKRLILAPAMNTAMWEHPLTARHLETVKSLGYEIIDPISKTLACGDIGVGAMAEPKDIAAHLTKPDSLS
ncbi:flavoprotein [Gorgonomyces haynaldii]|nr:flavoprotein [Gorgonomyces haynaldii]